jgi:hypothetical protein
VKSRRRSKVSSSLIDFTPFFDALMEDVMSRHHEFCTVEGCNKVPTGKLCAMHRSRWHRNKSFDDPRKQFKNDPNHSNGTLKICKKHGDLEHRNIYIVPGTKHMMCKICQHHNQTQRRCSRKSQENYFEQRKELKDFSCCHCKQIKPLDNFTKYWISRKSPICIECHRKFGRKSLLKKNFNMTLEEYEVISQSQNNKCAICKQHETVIHHSTKKLSCLSVDHNHSTNKNRGLLCQLCNFGIGYFKDSPDLLREAALYLEKYA